MSRHPCLPQSYLRVQLPLERIQLPLERGVHLKALDEPPRCLRVQIRLRPVHRVDVGRQLGVHGHKLAGADRELIYFSLMLDGEPAIGP